MTDADTNRIIAEAMGWTDLTLRKVTWRASESLQGHRPGSRHHWYGVPDYLHDANAIVEAAEHLSPGYHVQHSWSDGYTATSGDGHHICNDMKFTRAMRAMILAVLAERKDAT